MVVDAGNRETYQEGEYSPESNPPAGSPYENAQKNRRFQVYVHSKLMIVDDEVFLPLLYLMMLFLHYLLNMEPPMGIALSLLS